jgi:hypothetical protein
MERRIFYAIFTPLTVSFVWWEGGMGIDFLIVMDVAYRIKSADREKIDRKTNWSL